MHKHLLFKLTLLLALIISLGFISHPHRITVYQIGSSVRMAIKRAQAYPETSWGMPFIYFFDETVTIDNQAVNGRSPQIFISENQWQPVVDKL